MENNGHKRAALEKLRKDPEILEKTLKRMEYTARKAGNREQLQRVSSIRKKLGLVPALGEEATEKGAKLMKAAPSKSPKPSIRVKGQKEVIDTMTPQRITRKKTALDQLRKAGKLKKLGKLGVVGGLAGLGSLASSHPAEAAVDVVSAVPLPPPLEAAKLALTPSMVGQTPEGEMIEDPSSSSQRREAIEDMLARENLEQELVQRVASGSEGSPFASQLQRSAQARRRGLEALGSQEE